MRNSSFWSLIKVNKPSETIFLGSFGSIIFLVHPCITWNILRKLIRVQNGVFSPTNLSFPPLWNSVEANPKVSFNIMKIFLTTNIMKLTLHKKKHFIWSIWYSIICLDFISSMWNNIYLVHIRLRFHKCILFII